MKHNLLGEELHKKLQSAIKKVMAFYLAGIQLKKFGETTFGIGVRHLLVCSGQNVEKLVFQLPLLSPDSSLLLSTISAGNSNSSLCQTSGGRLVHLYSLNPERQALESEKRDILQQVRYSVQSRGQDPWVAGTGEGQVSVGVLHFV